MVKQHIKKQQKAKSSQVPVPGNPGGMCTESGHDKIVVFVTANMVFPIE